MCRALVLPKADLGLTPGIIHCSISPARRSLCAYSGVISSDYQWKWSKTKPKIITKQNNIGSYFFSVAKYDTLCISEMILVFNPSFCYLSWNMIGPPSQDRHMIWTAKSITCLYYILFLKEKLN